VVISKGFLKLIKVLFFKIVIKMSLIFGRYQVRIQKSTVSSEKLNKLLIQVSGVGVTRAKWLVALSGLTEFSFARDVFRSSAIAREKIISSSFLKYNKNFVGLDFSKRLESIKKRLLSSGSFRGQRLKFGLPINFQRTRSNASTPKKLKNNSKK
jgi:ribosomal protein S13